MAMYIEFPTGSHVDVILDGLYTDIELFGRTSLARLYSLSLIPTSENKENEALGWDEEAFNKVSVKRERFGGYVLELPDPEEIQPLPDWFV